MHGPDTGDPRPASWIVAGATLLCLLPFAGKAFHVDDHRYVDMARQIRSDPADFFGFHVNLGGSEQLFANMGNNPPFGSFYLAAASLLTGWSELGLHLALLVPALVVTLCCAALARRSGADPTLAGLLCLACPAFLVSATTVMASVTMLALFCASVLCWMRGLEEQQPAWLVAGAGLAALCALTKYFGMALIPLLLLAAVHRERRLGAWTAALLLPLAALALFELYTWQTYGVSPLLRASGYSIRSRPAESGGLDRWVVSIAFAGGVLAPVLLAAPLAFSRRMLVAALAVGAGLLAAWRVAVGGFETPGFALHVAAFALAGAALWVLIFAELSRWRDTWTLVLVAWAAGSFVFAAFVNYTTNARTLLPMAPPVAILLARRLRGAGAFRRYAPLAPALVLGLVVAWGDASLADASRVAARRIAASFRDGPGTLWVDGYWGFQHYMREAGARSLDVRRNILRPGDVVARHTNSKVHIGIAPEAATLVETVEVPVGWLTTMALDTATGFYAIQWGPLPYRFAPGYAERFEVRRLDHAVVFEKDPEVIEARRGELERADTARALLFALDELGWPRDAADARSAAAWEACVPQFRRIAQAVSSRCRWCTTRSECDACLLEEAERTGSEPACRDLLGAATRAWWTRCGAWIGAGARASGGPEDRVCARALQVRARLAGSPAR